MTLSDEFCIDHGTNLPLTNFVKSFSKGVHVRSSKFTGLFEA